MAQLRDHVRLKPYNPPKKHLKRFYAAPWPLSYEQGIWIVHDPSVAEERARWLEKVRDQNEDKNSPLAFDVCTRKEAEDIKLREETADLEQVTRATLQDQMVAPTTPGGAAVSDLNLPMPKSELAAAAMARQEEEQKPPPVPKTAKTKVGRTRTRTRTRRT
jgi:hypothetical protein